jgi:hypothetical protein
LEIRAAYYATPESAGQRFTLLKKAFTEDAMSPAQAAQQVGVTYATAKR